MLQVLLEMSMKRSVALCQAYEWRDMQRMSKDQDAVKEILTSVIRMKDNVCLRPSPPMTFMFEQTEQFVMLQSYGVFSQASKQNITNLKTSNILM